MAPYLGQCLCGAVRYRVHREPLAVYACHCTDCQRRTGSAFAMSMIVRPEDLELVAGETTSYLARLPDGRTKSGQMCLACGTRLWGTPVKHPEIRVVQPGTLDQPCRLAPALHQWVSEAQPWLTLPPGVPTYDRDPPDPRDYVRLRRDKDNPMNTSVIQVGQLGIDYIVDGAETKSLGMFELTVPPGSNVPPPHSHTNNEECVYVLAGTLRYTVGAETRDLTVGQTMSTPRGAVHAFSNPFAETARALIVNSPDIGAQYFRDVAAVVNAGGPPDKAALASVMARYGLVPAPPN